MFIRISTNSTVKWSRLREQVARRNAGEKRVRVLRSLIVYLRNRAVFTQSKESVAVSEKTAQKPV